MKYLLILLISLPLSAAIEDNSIKEALKRRKAGLTSRITHKRLERAFRYSRNKEVDKATVELVKLLKQTKSRKYENAVVWQNLGFMLAGADKKEKAIKALENSLKLNALPYNQTLSSLYTLSQLYFANENVEKAHECLKEWFELVDDPKAQAYMLMGMILGQKGEKEKALDYVNTAINKNEESPEKWLRFALSLNHSLKKYKNALKLLVILTSEYPEKPIYWKQFYQTYLSLYQDEKAMAVMDMAYKKDFLNTEGDILNMVSMMLFLKMPHKAARILSKEIAAKRVKESQKNYELLSQAWYQAKEYDLAIKVLDRAGSISLDGNVFAKKGYMQLETEKWSEAIQSFKRSLSKGKLKSRSKVYFALGLAYYNKKNLSDALGALNRAKRLDKKNRSIVTWINQIKDQRVAQNEVSI